MTRQLTSQFTFVDYSAIVLVGFTLRGAASNDSDEKYQLRVFDTTHQEEFDRLRGLLYPETDVFLLCFSKDKLESLKSLERSWFPEIRRFCPTTPIIVIGTHSPIEGDVIKRKVPEVTYSDGLQMGKALEAAKYMECYPDTRVGVSEAFDEVNGFRFRRG
jgi:GTPase SAR1 family protein